MSLVHNIYNMSPVLFQTIILNLKAFELYIERYGKNFWKTYKEFNRIQWLSQADIREYQNERLIGLVRHAYENVPYYHRVMKKLKLVPNDIRSTSDLPKLPILTRKELKTYYKDLLSRGYRSYQLRQGHTSGTTGSPIEITYDIQTCVAHHAADWRQKTWAGLEYGTPYASMQGKVIVPIHQMNPPFWRKNYINNQLFLSSFHLKKQNIPCYIEKLEKSGIKFIEGYPSTLYILALYLNKRKRYLPMKAVLTSSETLFSFQREAIETAFSCKVFDFYGMAERAVYATECSEHSGHHLNQDYGITEFLDSNYEPVTPGKLGRIVATSLHNYAMPIIRYQTNDSSVLKTTECPCGRSFPLMDAVTTKEESIITLPDGRLISPSILTHPFKPIENIIESQILQIALDHLIIKIVRDKKYSSEDEFILLTGFRERLGEDIKIHIDYVDSIPRTPSGKLKWVVSNISPSI